MRIQSSHTQNAGSAPNGACIAIGAFDGVHLGHQALIETMLRCARSRGVAALVQTFDPLPKVVFGRGRAGDLELLATRFKVTTADCVTCSDGERISSTRIRHLRASGRAGAARALLGLLPGAIALARDTASAPISPLTPETLS
ncbi:hypothetical protein [Nitratireductor indicus]|uniref:hypothetical protein n=1 Tax=Nitratireductor indicus TaxID=721133 RepID=UPI002875B6E1|nr:hypothetical protein [Nitratireductor indicus]MDS1137718.1 hypothetical protein [Nitratireductor indicus]